VQAGASHRAVNLAGREVGGGVAAAGAPARRARAGRWAGYALALLLPLAVYWPVGRSPAPGVLDIYVRPGLYPSDLALAVLLVACLAQHRPLEGVGGHGREMGLWAALVGLGLLTAPWALSPALATYTAVRWLLALGVYASFARGDVAPASWATVFAIGLGVQVCVGIAQVVAQGPLGLPGEVALAAGQPGAAILTVGDNRWLRAYGLAFHPNVLGGCLAVGLLLSLPLLARRWMRPLWWLLGTGLLLSFSRSAWLAAGLVLPPLAGWLAWRRQELRRPLAVTLGAAGLILIVAAGLLMPQILSRLDPLATATESRSLQERGALIGLALDVVRERPLAGVGAGNLALALQHVDAEISPQPVHYVPLLLAAEVGLLGGGIWAWLWLAPGLALAGRLREAGPWPVFLSATWFAWGAIGLWDSYPWALNSGLLLGASLLGLLAHARRAEAVP
jgi:hypothetical protein